MTTNHATIEIASGDALDVRTFAIKQGISQLFNIEVRAVSRSLDIDFDEVIGKPASLSLRTSHAAPSWQGICSQIEQLRVDAQGLATYALTIQPRAWMMTQRKNYRIFQFETELDIVKKMLGEWGVQFEERLDPANYKPRKYRCQYGETDFAFMSRMLEDAGACYYFEQKDGQSILVLDDAPHARDLKKPQLRFHDAPTTIDDEFVTRVSIAQRVRPGKVTIADLDYRKPATNQPRLSATGGLPQEQELEQFHYEPGAFLYKSEGGGSTPSADDRGSSRTDEQLGNAKTQNRLHGKRGSAKRITFESNALDLAPGLITSVVNHPHRVLAAGSLLVTDALIEGDHDSEWRVHAEVVPTDTPYKPDTKTARPKVTGLESATVVGPEGEEIHTDEYGRVRVQFHWDREGKRNETSSCWIPSSQPWAGAGFGGVNLPRIGQEVLVEFLGGDPDRPVVVGRVFTETQPPPYKLPDFKKVSGLRSESSPRVVSGAADGDSGAGMPSMGGILGGNATPLGNAGIAEALNHPFFGAKSPDQQTHAWRGNEVSFFDQPGKQQLYLQAERDMNVVVKNSQTSVISNVRSAQVGTDDVLSVGHKQLNVIGDNQMTSVGGDRSVYVVKNQSHVVTGDISVEGQSNQTYDITETFKSTSKVHHFISQEKIILQVGSSTIVMQPNFIVIQADDVFINPGAEDTRKAMDGDRPEKPEERQDRERFEQNREAARQAWLFANNYLKEPMVQQGRANLGLNTPESDQEFLQHHFDSKYRTFGGTPGDTEAIRQGKELAELEMQ
ncbi:type VI secretion system Vgr family protein [Polyangium aurulentum]|uniref:type VI secretion system Vgr family protein n=1 Tax=Polyangium aurulentum TaxID=2567896 RepID=UPI0010ADE0E6|nr:type VI secretion system tip protein TssI/VgrG [Polyangium aurulentum]UQA57164.1 type VI secretion system tip protein VgrG [Polyangium aurulentum]